MLVADVGDTGEAAGEGVPDRITPDEALAPRVRPSGRLEDGIVGEVSEDPIEVVLIERRRDRLQDP